MKTSGFFDSDPMRLADMVDSSENVHTWSESELGQIWSHLLDAQLSEELAIVEPELESLRLASDNPDSRPRSFRELFVHEAPPIALLRLVKEYGKAARAHQELGLPGHVATVIYFLAIALALARRGDSISDLSADALKTGLQWCRGRLWLDSETRDLFGEIAGATSKPSPLLREEETDDGCPLG